MDRTDVIRPRWPNHLGIYLTVIRPGPVLVGDRVEVD